MARDDTVLKTLALGALAGLAGTAVLTVAIQATPYVLDRLGLPPLTPPVGEHQSGNPNVSDEPTELLAEKMAEQAAGTTLNDETREVAGQILHWGYGAAWGAVYGLAESRLDAPLVLGATVFGGVIALVANTVMPELGVMRGPGQQPTSKTVLQSGLAMLYGWTTALAFRALAHDEA